MVSRVNNNNSNPPANAVVVVIGILTKVAFFTLIDEKKGV